MGKGLVGRMVIVVATLACAGCYATRDQLTRRAAFDLRCTKDELRITRIDNRTRGVRGCGWQATYVQSCDRLHNGVAVDCTWVLDEKQRDAD